jgi:hypothetical protein
MSLLRGWFKPDFANPGERFTDLDGAPYDGKPEGERPIRRALRTPTFKATVIAGLFLGAGAALCVSQSAKQDVLFVLSVAIPGGSIVLLKADARDRRREYPPLRNVVIDKAGRALSDPDVLFAADDHYRRDIESTPRFLPVIPLLVTAGLTAFNHMMGLPALANAGVAAAVAVGLAVPFAARAVWAAYARRQLQDRRWTVTANPPPLKKEAKEPARPGVRLALVPIRAHATCASNAR